MFDICNLNTWDDASDNEFSWKGEYTFSDTSTGKNITEKIMVLQIRAIFSALEQSVSKQSYDNYNKSELVKCILDNFSHSRSPNEIMPILHIMVEKGFSQNTSEEILRKYDNKTDKESADFDNSIVASQSKDQGMHDSDHRWADIILTGENEPLLEGTRWKSVEAEEIAGMISINEFQKDGKLVRTSYFLKKYGDSRDEVKTRIDAWSRDGDNIKMIYGDGATLLEGKYHQNIKKIITVKYFSDGKTTKDTFVPFIKNEIVNTGKSNDTRNSNINNNISNNYIEPPSKGFIVAAVALLIIGAWMGASSITGHDTNIYLMIFGFIVMGLTLIPTNIYLSARSKFYYKAVCTDMARWVGRSSNDLIIQWGAPTKTYKFPSDKSMTVFEYKDSIRNYAGYRSKGLYMGQSKTTKYVKSFFVKDGIIVSYKYAIT